MGVVKITSVYMLMGMLILISLYMKTCSIALLLVIPNLVTNVIRAKLEIIRNVVEHKNTESHLCMICLQACLISEEVIFSCCGVLLASSVKIYGYSSIFLGKFMDCFSIIPMEKQAINFPNIVHNARSCCQV